MKILVTGTSGRFGPYVLRELEGAGHETTMFDKLKPPDAFSNRTWVQGELTNFDDCRRAVAAGQFDALLHLAAQPWPTDHARQQQRREQAGLPLNHTMSVNVLGTYNILHAALLGGIKLFVMTSTNCAIGHTMRTSGRDFPCERLPFDEHQTADIEDSYSFSKMVCERLCEMYSRVHGMRTYALRCAGLFDAETRRKLAESNKPVEKWDWGVWAWVAREDAAAAHRLVLENSGKLAPHEVFLCTADETFAIEPSMELVRKFRPDLLPLVAEKLEGHASFFSSRKLKQAVGWAPKISWPRTQ
jgi:nucleoside-diphosphate-sugar epimerase